MADIVWTKESLSDLEAIGDYFEWSSPQYATTIVDRLYTSVEPLSEPPKMGRRVPGVDHEAPRELSLRAIELVYQPREERIEIITVVHSRRDLPKEFRRRGNTREGADVARGDGQFLQKREASTAESQPFLMHNFAQ